MTYDHLLSTNLHVLRSTLWGMFLQVAAVVREQQQRREESARRVEKANIGLTIMVRKLERSVHVRITDRS